MGLNTVLKTEPRAYILQTVPVEAVNKTSFRSSLVSNGTWGNEGAVLNMITTEEILFRNHDMCAPGLHIKISALLPNGRALKRIVRE